MRIIVEGQRPEDVIHRVTCSHCKCVFEFETKEADRIYDQREGDYFKIACPTCLNQVNKSVRP